MSTGVYERTEEHRCINSEGHKKYFKKNPEARRQISISVMRTNYLKELREADKGKHGVKPDEAYELIEKASYPPYLDVFGRRKREGWSVFGDVNSMGV
jgi:N6-adenosine-specific RNA methylase IME4